MKNNRNAYLKDENLLTLFSLNNLIVPEIQREYVWGNNPDVLEKFLEDLESKASPCCSCHHVHTTKNINIGFLYSYKPLYVKFENERILDEYLIDGQQRITTLFLLLLYRATIENRMDDFISIFRIDEVSFEMGFNYKVRNLTQHFIIQLIEHAKLKGNKSFDFVKDISNDRPYWFLNDYMTDPTVMSMINAIKSMVKKIGNPDNYYFDFLLTNIHFWHFKTEATSQGEELYITMNSRGEQLSDNEMKKAKTLPPNQLLDFGEKWENWQTLFWRNRGKNFNSDKGFNNFLYAIEGLESFLNKIYSDNCQKIKSIENYINGLSYITGKEFKESIYKQYEGLYLDWFKNCIDEIWRQINSYDGTWNIIDPRGKGDEIQKDYKNKSIARNISMLFWPWMYYFAVLNGNKPDDQFLIRLLHFYYIRYNCYKRSTTTIKVIVDTTSANDFILNPSINNEDTEEEDNTNAKTFSEEELIISHLSCLNPKERNKIESLIWKIQDLDYFIDGKSVGGNTVLNFIKKDSGIIDENNLESSLCSLYENIKSILTEGNDRYGNIIVKEILLFYKFDQRTFWIQQSPWYYSNYETSSWKRIVRTPHFLNFYKDYIDSETCLKDFLEQKRNEFFKEHLPINRSETQFSHRKLCIIYDAISNNVWDSEHDNVVFWRDENSVDEIFYGQDSIWKGKRYYDQNAKIKLPDNWQKLLADKYQIKIIDKK